MKCRRGVWFRVVSRAESLAALNDGSAGNSLLNWGSCLSVQVFLSGLLSPEAHVSPAIQIHLSHHGGKPLPLCSLSYTSSSISIISGHYGCCSVFKCCFFTFTVMVGFFHCPLFSNFGKEIIPIKQNFLCIFFSQFLLIYDLLK